MAYTLPEKIYERLEEKLGKETASILLNQNSLELKQMPAVYKALESDLNKAFES